MDSDQMYLVMPTLIATAELTSNVDFLLKYLQNAL